MIISRSNDSNNRHNALDPDICPHCHHANAPRLINQHYDNVEKKNFSTWQCASHKCKRIFIAQHLQVGDGNGSVFTLERFLNGSPKGPIWPEPIINLKDGKTLDTAEEEPSRFTRIYQQSLEAESKGLDEIAGMGYRKAIEFLVADWAIQEKTEDRAKILANSLSKNIREYYEDDLKDILDRATWLGNDQVHINVLHEKYDVQNVKELIALIVSELDSIFKKKKYIASIQPKKK